MTTIGEKLGIKETYDDKLRIKTFDSEEVSVEYNYDVPGTSKVVTATNKIDGRIIEGHYHPKFKDKIILYIDKQKDVYRKASLEYNDDGKLISVNETTEATSDETDLLEHCYGEFVDGRVWGILVSKYGEYSHKLYQDTFII